MACFLKSLMSNIPIRKCIANPAHIRRIMNDPNLMVPAYLMDRTKPAKEILQNLKPDDNQRLQTIKAEFENFLQQGAKVPSELHDEHLLDLLCCTGISARIRLYTFLFKNEKKRENKEKKKALKESYQPPERDPAGSTRILRVIDEKPIRTHWNYWQWAEMRCPDAAQPLIFDFMHESEMRIQDQKNLASQMVYVMLQNRLMKPHPFHLVLCGLQPGTNQYTFMESQFGVNYKTSTIQSLTDLPWTISPNHFVEDYPIENHERPVILLSPNAPRAFEPGEWDHNAAYVVGAVVDKSVRRPVTFAKARMLGINCIRLPLERYMKWSPGRSKTLTINCIHAIMATAKKTNGDWEKALKENIPKRFFAESDSTERQFARVFSRI